VRDLDDPANPYREKYGTWDRWLLANAKNPTMEEMQAFMAGSAPEGYIYLRPTVSEEGWLIPQLEELRTQFEQQTDYAAYRARPSCILTFSASGVADLATAQGLEQARLKLWAELLPHAAAWLTSAMPKRVVLLPDGGAVTYGPLGSAGKVTDAASFRYDAEGNPEVYYRYDASGKEVAHTTPGQPWQELFMPGYTQDVLLGAAKEGMIPIVLNGYTILAAQATSEPVKVFDYTGAVLAPGDMKNVDKGRLLVEVEGEFLSKVAPLQKTQARN
jgi:hypothetical protein